MKIHYVQHVAFEDPAQILTWALSNGHALAATRLHLNERLPDPDEFDLLIIMGGPMSVHDHDRYSWLKDEKKFIESAIATGKKVLGICLGAQLIAHVLGAPVKKNRTPEIGWYEVFRTEDSGNSIFAALPPSFMAFHWHGDTFDIPRKALRLAASDACENQAFSYARNVLALQFHLEATPQSIEKLITACPDDLARGAFVQPARTILELTGENMASCASSLRDLLDTFTK